MKKIFGLKFEDGYRGPSATRKSNSYEGKDANSAGEVRSYRLRWTGHILDKFNSKSTT